MTNAEIILETAAWIEERLHDELPVPAIAARAGYSVHHFARLFAGVVGLAPREYVAKRKLSEAGKALASGRRVTDVAFEFGFHDLETFSRAFRRELGVTPSAVRRGASFPYLASAERLRHAAKLQTEPELEVLPALLLAGRSIQATGEAGEVARLWSEFVPRAPSVPRIARPPRFRQLAWWAEQGECPINIMAAAEMESLDELPMDLVGKAVPPCECLVFTHHGSVASVGQSYEAIYARILPSLDRRPSLPFCLESYFDDAGDPYADGYRFRILVPLGAPR